MPRLAVATRRHASRLDRVLTLFGWILVAGFAVVTVVPGLGENYVFLGTDLLTSWAPWSSTAVSDVVNRGVSDTIDSATPMSILITESARSGVFAQWDPYNNGGVELAALPNSAVLSPLSLPWWILPASMAPAGVKILEIAAIGLGFHLLLRRQWHLPAVTAPLATLIYVASGFMVAWTNWPQTRVAALIPLLMWAVDALAVRRQWRYVLAIGVVVASMLLGGFPAVTAYALYCAAIWFVVRSLLTPGAWRRKVIGVGKAGVGLVLAFCLSAVQMLPFVWFTLHNVDFDARAETVGDTLPSTTLATTVVPFQLGPPDWSYGSWPIHFVEGFSYFGAATLVLIAAALLVKPRYAHPRGAVITCTAMFLVVMIAMYFDGPIFEVVHSLPGISTSAIGRMRSVMGFLAAVLAALGTAALFDPERLSFRRSTADESTPARTWSLKRVLPLVVRVMLAGAIVGIICSQVLAAYNVAPSSTAKMWILLALVIVAGTTVVALIAWLLPRRTTCGLAVVIALIATAVPAAYVAHRWWPLSDSSTFYPETSTHEFLQENLGQNRYATVGWTMVPGTSSAYQLRSLTGHGFTSTQWRELMNTIEPGFFQTATWSTLTADNIEETLTSGILDRYGVSYVVCSIDDCGDFQPSASSGLLVSTNDDDIVIITRTTADNRIRWASSELVIEDSDARLQAMADPATSSTAVILEHADDAEGVDGTSSADVASRDIDTNHIEVDVQSDGAGWVVIADPLRDNGWSVTVDGNDAELVDAEHAGVAVYVPSAGSHTVELSYSAPWFTQGITISATTIVAIIGIVVAGLFQRSSRRKHRADSGAQQACEPNAQQQRRVGPPDETVREIE